MERYLKNHIYTDLENKKIVLIMGPRQCGKTTLSKNLYKDFDYFNYDSAEDRLSLKEKSWNREKTLIIFDELHKMKSWKRWLKGVYDTEGIPPKLLVTGSARLDVHGRAGDSLAGRYFQYHLHPLDLKEAHQLWDHHDENEIFERLWNCSGFPEPFLKGDATYYRRWRRSHLDTILRQDLIDLESVRDITGIETLVVLLKSRVGGSISYANLARDLERDPNTVKRWLKLLENLYIIFRVTPYSKNIVRSLLKEPKFYFYDHTYAEGDGARLENLVACALIKELHFLEDTTGIETKLHYLRTKDGKELDFLITQENKPTHGIEVKSTDDQPSPSFHYFAQFLPKVRFIQLVKTLKREKTFPEGFAIKFLIPWLKNIDLKSN